MKRSFAKISAPSTGTCLANRSGAWIRRARCHFRILTGTSEAPSPNGLRRRFEDSPREPARQPFQGACMDLGITGKVALVTGGSHGMGRSISEELGRNGCKVVVVARGREQLDRTVKAITDEGGEAIAVSADLSSFDSF